MPPYKVSFDAIPWESPIPGVRHKVLEHDGQKLRLVEYTQQMAPHWCAVGHIGQILDGRFEIEFDNETHIFEAGDGVLIPQGATHRHRARALTEVVRAIFVEAV
ncbi:MAG: cupin domain-containing protein [Gammaproteobacteria bacterium]|nr:cupin domain-containing protein [Gammaproteobacteria bacterium]